MFRKYIYKWHRTLSLIIAVPVLLWALSGFMHPLMTNVRPKVATQSIQASAIDNGKIYLPLQEALLHNKIDSITRFRIIHIDSNYFYQVQQGSSATPLYISTKTGKILSNGDWLYAQYLAKLFLEGEKKNEVMQFAALPHTNNLSHDCCDAASNYVLNNNEGNTVRNATLLTQYDNEYKSINRLLPVYKVSFNRNDGIRIYVETTQDRFAFAMDNKRAVFDTLFQLFHTWGWLDMLGDGKLILEFLLATAAFITSFMGIYIFCITKSKKSNGNKIVKSRKWHRYTSIVVVLFTLMFTFSGAYHAFAKLKHDTKDNFALQQWFKTKELNLNLHQLQTIVQKPIANVNIVQIEKQTYWQVFFPTQKKNTDLMKSMQAMMPNIIYVNTSNLSVLGNGDKQYANYLATTFSNHNTSSIQSVSPITKFNDEYNFTDKRLPVWKIQYNSNNNERYYVETNSGTLAKKINDKDLYEGYSFALLHKHHFMDFAGKGWRDFSTMFWALSQVAMAGIGLVLYFRTKR